MGRRRGSIRRRRGLRRLRGDVLTDLLVVFGSVWPRIVDLSARFLASCLSLMDLGLHFAFASSLFLLRSKCFLHCVCMTVMIVSTILLFSDLGNYVGCVFSHCVCLAGSFYSLTFHCFCHHFGRVFLIVHV